MNRDWKPFSLNDDQWARLAGIVALPAEARGELQKILGRGAFVGKLEPSIAAPHETKKRLAAIRRRCEALLAELRRSVANHGDVLMALLSPPESADNSQHLGAPPVRLEGLRSLDRHVACVQSLATWLSAAEARMPKGKTGDKTLGPYYITRDIDELLWHYMKRRLTSGVKKSDPDEEFLGECFALVGAQVTPAAMIRRIASERRGKVSFKNSQKLRRAPSASGT